MLRRRGALLEAEEQSRQALQLSTECSHAFPDARAGPLDSLSLVLSEEGKLAEAEVRAQEFLDLFGRRHRQYWRTFNGQSKLGEILLRENRYAEAEPFLVSGYEGMRRHESEILDPNTRLKEACERLAHLYVAWKKPAQASEWQQKLADLEQKGKR